MTVFVLKKSSCCPFYINVFSDIPLDFTIINYTSFLKFYFLYHAVILRLAEHKITLKMKNID